MKKTGELFIKIFKAINEKLGAFLFIFGAIPIVIGIFFLTIRGGENILFSTLLIFVGLILWAIDAFWSGSTRLLPFSLLIVVWEICYIGFYYVFTGAEIQKTVWLYVGLFSLAIFSRQKGSEIKTASSISLYIFGIILFGSVLLFQAQNNEIGVGLIGSAIKFLAKIFSDYFTNIDFIKENVQPFFVELGENTDFEYYVYGFLSLYWLAKDKDVDNVIVAEKIPRILSAFTLILAGLYVTGFSLVSAYKTTTTDLSLVINILSIGLGLLVLLYGVNVVRGYKKKPIQ